MYRKTADEIEKLNPEIALIPVGSLEQHGPHLPVMTDWAIATELGQRVAQKMNAFLVPALPISTCREMMGKKGSVWMEPTTFYQMMYDIVMSLKQQGFKKVGILQVHGGIFIMTPLVRDLNARNNPDLMVAITSYGNFSGKLYENGIIESPPGTDLHAGESETSRMLVIAPETVKMENAVDFVPSFPRPYLNYGSIFRMSPSGIWGNATKASAEKGLIILNQVTDWMVEDLNKAFRYMEQKEPFNYSSF